MAPCPYFSYSLSLSLSLAHISCARVFIKNLIFSSISGHLTPLPLGTVLLSLSATGTHSSYLSLSKSVTERKGERGKERARAAIRNDLCRAIRVKGLCQLQSQHFYELKVPRPLPATCPTVVFASPVRKVRLSIAPCSPALPFSATPAPLTALSRNEVIWNLRLVVIIKSACCPPLAVSLTLQLSLCLFFDSTLSLSLSPFHCLLLAARFYGF